MITPDRGASRSAGFVYRITDDADGEAEAYVEIVVVPSNEDPTVGEDEGFVTPLGVPLVLRDSDLLANDFDIEQADRDGNARSTTTSTIRAVPAHLRRPRGRLRRRGARPRAAIPRGQVEVETWPARPSWSCVCPEGFTGAVAVE